MFRLLGCTLWSTILFGLGTAKGVHEPMHIQQEFREVRARQTTTSSTDCPQNDGYFYTTSHNYTYQIQCATTYTGEQIMTQPALGFTACILQCATYNHDNSTSSSFCVGVNFNAATDDSDGDCTLFDEVSPVPNQASEEGSIEDAALLIYGPSGQVFATPELQPSNVVGGILTNSLVFTSQPVFSVSSIPLPVSTAFVTSVVTVVSCTPGISNCPANGLTASTSLFTTSAALASPTPSISISLGGMRPLTKTDQLAPSSAATSASSTSLIGSVLSYLPSSVTLQATKTSIVPYTEYHVTTVVFCTEEPNTASCTTSANTQTVTGFRTEISCSPGACFGVMLATGTLAGMPGIFTGGCIVEST